MKEQQYGALHITQAVASIAQESSGPLIKKLHAVDDTA